MRDRLFQALKQSTADYAEIRFETNDSTSISYRGEEVEDVSSAKGGGGIVRACTRGGWGLATFDILDDLDTSVKEACEGAALVGREQTQLAEVDPPADAEIPAKLERDFRGVALDEKLDLASKYNDLILRTGPEIVSSHVRYGDTFRTVYFASSRGAYFREERPRVILAFGAVARDGSLVQQAMDSRTSATSYDVVLGLEPLVEETARRAVALLEAPPCKSGVYTVVLDPRLAGVFAHEAFGHLSEADFLHENPKLRDLLAVGRKMGVKDLNIVDDGSLEGLIGTQAFDDEGTPTRKTHLIKEGVLAGHLHSLETAAKMGEKPTGNARAVGPGAPPIVRMTNTYIEGGSLSFDEMLSGIDQGIYACQSLGGQTMIEMFTFSAAHGYRIENGQKGELIRDVVLTGNVFRTLHAIDGFGDDFRMCDHGGGCGKGGQAPLPVTFGAPHIRIRDVVVGGK